MGLIIATAILVALTIVAALVFRFFLVPKGASATPEGGLGELDHKLLKKYDSANIHRQRMYTLIIASFIVMVFAYVLIENKTYDEIITEQKEEIVQVTETMIDIPITEQPPPEPPKPKVSQVMKVVEDEEIIEEEIIKEEPLPDEELLFEEDIEEEIVEEEIEPQVHMMVEQEAVPPGGLMGFNDRLNSRIGELLSGMDLGGVSQGVIMLQFIVMENGQISNVEVLQGVDPKVDKAVAQEFVRTSPKWQAGKIQGQAVRQLMQYPIMIMFE